MKNVNKSVGKEDLLKYDHWMKEFGTVWNKIAFKQSKINKLFFTKSVIYLKNI